MAETNFYKILGLGRSASAEQIKVAYRKLVKKHHPDLFSGTSGKAKATEKLRLINEAYAVLGNPERRQRYDKEFAQKPPPRPRTPGAAARGKTPPPPPRPQRANVRPKTLKIPKVRLRVSKRQAGYALAATMVILLLFYAGRSEPRLALAWTLWEKLEVSPPQRVSTKHETSQDWMRLSQHASVADCTAVLRAIVRDDERAGSRAVYDEKNGTMAITVHVRNEGAPKNEQHGSSGQDGAATIPATEITKRVRNLECRATQHLQADSWFRRTLRKIGLVD